MREIQGNAGIGAVHLCQGKQVHAQIGQQGKGARLVRFVFHGNVECGVVIGHFGQSRDGGIPHGRIIALKAVIDPVLTQPQGHDLPPHFGQGIKTALGDVDGRAAHPRVGVGKGPKPKAGIGVIAHRKAVQGKARAREDFGHLRGCMRVEMVRVIQVGGIDSGHLACTGDHIGGGRLARQADLEGIEAGSIPRAVGQVGHVGLSQDQAGLNNSGRATIRGSRKVRSCPR